MEGCRGRCGERPHPSTSWPTCGKPSEPSLGASVLFHWGLVGVSWRHNDSITGCLVMDLLSSLCPPERSEWG